jgi:hypothetical protein
MTTKRRRRAYRGACNNAGLPAVTGWDRWCFAAA